MTEFRKGGADSMHPWTDQYLCVNGVKIRYREAGEGPPLVLVHGIAGFLEEWEPAMETLSGRFRVIALDLPGHGMSDKPDIPYTLERLAGFLKDFIAARTSGKIHLAGHSLGGAICLNLVIRNPGLVERLILVNSVFLKIPFPLRLGSFRFLRHLPLKIPPFLVKASLARSFCKKECITEKWLQWACKYINNPGAIRTMFSILHSNITLRGLRKETVASFLDGVSRVDIPVLILYGDKDRILPGENSTHAHRCLKNSQIIVVENCGHELQYESSAAFCEHAVKFLS